MKDEKIALYKLIDGEGNVIYVGQTNNIKNRMYRHLNAKPCKGNGSGTFYGRKDITPEIIEYVYTRKEAFKREEELQKEYGLTTDNEHRMEWRLKGGIYWYEKTKEEQSKRMKEFWATISEERKRIQGEILTKGRKNKKQLCIA